MTRELTGRHVLMIVTAAFAVIIGANLTMLFAATGSFPGLVVQNSYVAGKGWDSRAAAQRDLGWSLRVDYRPGALSLHLIDAAGAPVTWVMPTVAVGRPTTSIDDRIATAIPDGAAFVVPMALSPGRWQVEITISEPVAFASRAEILVRGAE